MGHTVMSQRRVADIILKELSDYGKALTKQDREIYEKLLKKSLKHLGSISYADSFHVWAFILLSIILEQEKQYESMVNRCLQTQG